MSSSTQILGPTEKPWRRFARGRARRLVGVACLLSLAGCGPRAVTGGTPGTLTYRGEQRSDIQVTAYQVEGSQLEQVGFSVTANDGTFQLVTNGARGPLRLTPGDYRFTLESVGPPIRVAKKYTKPDSTPLKVSWSAGDKSLDLDVPPDSSE